MQSKPLSGNKTDLLPKKINCVNNNYFGETLKELRVLRNLKQYEAAQLLGITPAQWSIYESGKTRPNFDTIFAICEIFNVNPFAVICRSLDKSKYSGTGLELTLEEYENISLETIETFRKKKAEGKIRAINELVS